MSRSKMKLNTSFQNELVTKLDSTLAEFNGNDVVEITLTNFPLTSFVFNKIKLG